MSGGGSWTLVKSDEGRFDSCLQMFNVLNKIM